MNSGIDRSRLSGFPPPDAPGLPDLLPATNPERMMSKRKRLPRAKNKISGEHTGSLIKPELDPPPEQPAEVRVSQFVKITRSTLFTAELEAVIEIIAFDRVYRMLAGRRRLPAPDPTDADPRIITTRGDE